MARRGVVLDFDGVIARSLELHAESYRRVLLPFGVQPSVEEIFVREGSRSESIIEDLLRGRKPPIPKDRIKRLAEEKQTIFATLGPVPLYEGAEDLVRRVRAAAHSLGLVTGTRRANLSRFIPHLLPLFNAVLAQDSYTHDKPHPEPYLKAAEALGLRPGECAALENADFGVQSARAANYGFVLGITTTRPRDALARAGAHKVAPTHEEAAGQLAKWAGA